jgi:hypothetical protein
MTRRILLAGILGGLAMYVWTFIAHMFLPLGEIGIREMPNEQPVLAAMSASIGNSAGLYFFPGTGLGPNASAEQRRAAMSQYEQRLASSPSGLIVYQTPGAGGMTVGRLITEFVTELIEALLAAFLLAQTRIATFAGRIGFVAVTGVLASIATNVSYWNWYGFPTTYTASYIFTGVAGFVCAGLVIAAMIKPAGSARVATG